MFVVRGHDGDMESLSDHKDCRTIVVDEDVFRELQHQAEPLVDDANAVLRRVLGLDVASSGTSLPPVASPSNGSSTRSATKPKPGTRKRTSGKSQRKRAPKGSLLPEADYELPLLEALDELGGSGPASVVVNRVGEKLHDKLTAVDLEQVSSGEVRWKNRVQFVRLGLIKAGLMKDDSPRGTWEIAEPGRIRLGQTTGTAA